MIRNLKVLGLALVAVFALSAVIASAASAQVGTLTTSGPTTLLGTQTPVENPTEKNVLTAFGSTTDCPNATYTGHKYNVTPHTFIPNDVSTFTITPHYGVCTTSPGALPTTIDMNGCDYVFHLEGTTPGVDTYTIRATVVCPANQHITVTVFANAIKHAENKPFCDLTITENAAGYLGLHATDTTNGKIDITGTITGITAHKVRLNESILCPKVAETTNEATLAQDVTIEGRNEGGTATSISLSHL